MKKESLKTNARATVIEMSSRKKNRSPVGDAVCARRKSLGLSQRELAQSAGTTAGAICHIELGVRQLSAGLLARLASALDCRTDELLEGVVAPERVDRTIRQVVAAMNLLPASARKEVVEFCEFLKHRNRKTANA